MGEFFGVDWAGKRWIIVRATEESVTIDAQPCRQ